jgi:signal transduction histidine kinase
LARMTGQRHLAWTWLILAVAMALVPARASAANERKQVLVLFSMRRDTQIAIIGDREMPRLLERGLSNKIDYYSEYIDAGRFSDAQYQTAFRQYLALKYGGSRLDLVIAMQEIAIEFVARYRDELFPDTALVFQALRLPVPHVANATGIVTDFEFRRTLAMALELQPDTTHVFVVSGSSVRDRQYEAIARAQFRSFEPRVTVDYLSGLASGELERRLAALPERSIVYYVLFEQDGDGEKVNPLEYLDRLSTISSRPIYSWAESTMNRGTVGGSLTTLQSQIEAVGDVALRVLRGERADSIPVVTDANLNVEQVDWRQLRRWNISEARVRPGTAILFRDPGIWKRYRRYILGVLAIVLTQSAWIIGLLVQVARRKRAENTIRESQAELRASYDQNRDLSARLLAAQEVERTRIARELHDDICQQTALLMIDLQRLSDGEAGERFHDVSERGQQIAKSLHDLSHRLHPAKLQLMGLVPALQSLEHEFSNADIAVTLSCDQELSAAAVPYEITLTLYRVVQEALINATKHSGAVEVVVQLKAERTGLVLTIADDGVGFDVPAKWGKGLGLISMRERVEATGGRLNVRATPGSGTRLEITVPLDLAHRANVVEV